MPLCRFRRRELLLEVGDHAIGQFAGALIFAAALRLGEFVARLLELLLELLGAAELVLLRLPARGERGRFLFEIGELAFELREPVLRGRRRSPSSAPPARS